MLSVMRVTCAESPCSSQSQESRSDAPASWAGRRAQQVGTQQPGLWEIRAVASRLHGGPRWAACHTVRIVPAPSIDKIKHVTIH